jgi:hypothetical protein
VEEEEEGGGLPVMTALPSEGRKARSLALSVSRAFPGQGHNGLGIMIMDSG